MKWTRYIWRGLIIIILCLLLLISTFATPWGTKTTLNIIHKMNNGIDFEYQKGSFLSGLSLHKILITQTGLHLSVEEIDIKLQGSCLWQGKVCIENLSADELYIDYLSSKINDESLQEIKKKSPVLIKLPLDLIVDKLNIEKLQIKTNEISVYAENLNLAFNAQGSSLHLFSPHADFVRVTLATTNNNQDNAKLYNALALSELAPISSPILLELEKLTINRIELLSTSSPHLVNHLKMSATWNLTNLKLQQLEFDYNNMGHFTMQGDADLANNYPLNFQAKADIQQIDFWPQINQSELDVAMQGDINQLLLTLSSKGNLHAEGLVQVQLSKSEPDFTATIDISNLPPLPGDFSEHLTDTSINIKADGTLVRQHLTLSSIFNGFGYEKAQISASFVHQEQHLEISKLSFFDSLHKSQASVNGWIDYQQGINWKTTINLHDFVLPTLEIGQESLHGQVNGTFNSQGQWHSDNWQVSLLDTDITGQIQQMPARLSGNISLNNLGHMPQSEVHLEINGLTMDLAGYSDKDWHVNGRFQSHSLQSWHPQLAGSGLIELVINGALENPSITFTGGISKLLWQPINAPKVNFSGYYQPFQNHQIKFNTTADSVLVKQKHLQNFHLNFEGDASKQQLQVSSQGDIASKLLLQGQWFSEEQRWLGRLLKANLNVKTDQQITTAMQNIGSTLEKPLDLELQLANSTNNTSTLSITAHCWQINENQLCLQPGATIGESGNLAFQVDAELASFGELFLPPQLSLNSRLQGNVGITWNLDSLTQVNAILTLNEGQLELQNPNQPVDLLHWQQGRITIGSTNSDTTVAFILSQGQQQAELIDLDLQLNNVSHQLHGNLTLADLNISPFSIASEHIRELGGRLNADLTLAGNLQSPTFIGEVTISDANLGVHQSPQPVDNISMNVKLDGKIAKIQGEFFLDGQQANINGTANWQDEPSLQMTFDTQHLDIIYPPQLMASIQTELILNLQGRTAHLSGDLSVLSGQLTLEDLPQGQVNVSSDQVFIGNNAEPSANSEMSISSNINIDINQDFLLNGLGFTGNLRGQLKLEQNQDVVQLFGSLQIPEGSYQAYGQDLKVQTGNITFSGPATNPALDFKAIRPLSDEPIIAGIQIQGLADNLDLRFFSEPAMETAEIMSYVVRGRGLNSEGGGSSVLAVALGTNLVNRTNLLEEIESLSLIDDIEIDTSGQGNNAQATISGNIGERIFLKYGVGLYQPIKELTVRFYLLNRLWLETVNGLESSSGDIYYSFELD